MAYRDFKLSDLQQKFGIKQDKKRLFQKVIPPVPPSDWLVQTLERNNLSVPLTTEKAVSEAIILPILSEVLINNQDKISLFSGETLVGDKTAGLNGEIDFLFIKQARALEVYAPVINITEAKLNQALEKSIAQAAAQMLGAQLFNHKHNIPIENIYGTVTNGQTWIFLFLENNNLFVDTQQKFSTENLPELLGAFQLIIDTY